MGDCCDDYEEACLNTTDANSMDHGNSDNTIAHVCTKISSKHDVGVVMIGKCPTSWQDDVTRERCEEVTELGN